MIGLVVNPVAGIGGPAGLKGSDGAEVQAAARERGAVERAQQRAERTLRDIARVHPHAIIVTAAGSMGEDAVRAAGLQPHVVYTAAAQLAGVGGQTTTASDTAAAAAAIAESTADLLLFVGGDGTARDVCAGLPRGFPAIGVPAGVKMYSGCFAVSPAAAAALAVAWLDESNRPSLSEREVLDVVEEQVRSGRVDPRLYGSMMVPFIQGRTQSRKSATAASGREALMAAARGAVAEMSPGGVYLLGPGSTIAEVARQYGVASTPLGLDVVRDGHILLQDVSERQVRELLSTIDNSVPVKAVITVIGGQGFLLGRGNQQLSSTVLRRLGANPLMVIATEDKIIDLAGRPLLVDTGDNELDTSLAGFVRVITGPNSASIYPVEAPENERGVRTCV